MKRLLGFALALAACAQQQEGVRRTPGPSTATMPPAVDDAGVAEPRKPGTSEVMVMAADAGLPSPSGTREGGAPEVTTLPSGVTLLALPAMRARTPGSSAAGRMAAKPHFLPVSGSSKPWRVKTP